MLQNDEQLLVLALKKWMTGQFHYNNIWDNLSSMKQEKNKTKNSPRQSLTRLYTPTKRTTFGCPGFESLFKLSASCKKSCVSSSREQDFMATLVPVSRSTPSRTQHQRRRVPALCCDQRPALHVRPSTITIRPWGRSLSVS